MYRNFPAGRHCQLRCAPGHRRGTFQNPMPWKCRKRQTVRHDGKDGIPNDKPGDIATEKVPEHKSGGHGISQIFIIKCTQSFHYERPSARDEFPEKGPVFPGNAYLVGNDHCPSGKVFRREIIFVSRTETDIESPFRQSPETGHSRLHGSPCPPGLIPVIPLRAHQILRPAGLPEIHHIHS